MSRPHYDAFEAMIPPGLNVFRGSAPVKPVSSDYPYVVIGGNGGAEGADTPCGEPDSLDIRCKVTYAGLTFDSVLIMMEAVRSAVRGKRLDVPGWSSNLMRPTALMDITTDFDVTIPDIAVNPVFAVDEIQIRSHR